MLKLFKNNLFLIVILIIILLTFWDLPKTFYQQDEWQALGHNLAQGFENIFQYVSPLQIPFGEGRPLSRMFNLVFFGFFRFDVFAAAIFGIILHIINALLVYFLAQKLFGKKIISYLASLFFSVNSVSHQAVTWAATVGSLPAVTLILLSLMFYLDFLRSKNEKNLYLSFIFGLISLFFKETGLFLFLFYPLIYFFFKKANLREVASVHLPLLIYGGLLGITRFFGLFFRSDNTAPFVGASDNPVSSAILHSFLYPLSSLFQVFVPPLDLYSITPLVVQTQYKFLIGSPLKDLVGQSIVTDMISIFGGMLILGLLFLIVYKTKDKTVSRGISFAVMLVFLSFLTYVFLHRESSYLSSRHFYVGGIGAGILFGYVVYFLSNLSKFSKLVVFPLVFLFLFHHASIIRGDIDHQVKLGNERKAVLNGIKELKPVLENKTIFYVTSDKEYYGPITNPFQNGLGYVLENWYYDTEKIPKEFLSNNFLWDLGSEGYMELGEKGFGYFQSIDKMVEEMEKNKLKASVVHAFFIRSSDAKVLDITIDIRERISTISAIAK